MSNGIHSCGYHCGRPACIEAQRNHLYAENERLREAARMALEALERPNQGLRPVNGEWRSVPSLAIDALREALGSAE